PEGKDMPGIRVLLHHLLGQHRQTIYALPHINGTTCNPDLCSHRHRDHGRHPSSASASCAARPGTAASDRRKTRPLRNTTSTIDPAHSLFAAATVTSAKRDWSSGVVDRAPALASCLSMLKTPKHPA